MEIDEDMDIEMDSVMSDSEYQKQLDPRFLVRDNDADDEVANSGLAYPYIYTHNPFILPFSITLT